MKYHSTIPVLFVLLLIPLFAAHVTLDRDYVWCTTVLLAVPFRALQKEIKGDFLLFCKFINNHKTTPKNTDYFSNRKGTDKSAYTFYKLIPKNWKKRLKALYKFWRLVISLLLVLFSLSLIPS